MKYAAPIAFAASLLSSCQNAGQIDQALPTTNASNPPAPTGTVAQIVSGRRFAGSGATYTFASNSIYRYESRGYSWFTRWSAKGDQLCLEAERRRCSKLKSKGGDRYGWSFGGRTEISARRLDGAPIDTEGPIPADAQVLSAEEALAFLQSKTHSVPSRTRPLTVTTSGNRISIRGQRTESASLTPKNGKLCGSFRFGSTSCITVYKRGGRSFIVSERGSGKQTSRWRVIE